MPNRRAIFDTKNILVIGGAGFIGQHLCRLLLEQSKVICLDNFVTGDQANIQPFLQNKNFRFLNFDINSTIDLEAQGELAELRVAFQGVQEIYYLASPASPARYSQMPVETMLVNSVGLRNALEIAVKYQAKFLYVSSPAVYGTGTAKMKIKESYVGPVNQLAPRSVFAEAKRFGEALVWAYKQKYQLDGKIARVFNCYGPGMRLDDGRMIPELAKAAIEGRKLTVLGKEDDVSCLVYVDDVAKGLMRLMDGNESGPYNIASEWPVTYAEIAQKIVAISKSQSKIEYVDRTAPFEVQPLADISQAKTNLGWFPVVLLDQGLTDTISYLSAQEGIRRPEKL